MNSEPNTQTTHFFYTIRPATVNDVPFLWEMLYESIYVPEDKPQPDRALLQEPAFAHYLTDWGERDGDVGLIAINTDNIEPIGAVWTRLFPIDDPGWGFVDAQTPELGIAIRPTYRGQGIGTTLLTALIAQMTGRFPALSLSVDPENPAMNLYTRLGFAVVGASGTSLTMQKML
ncbi:MAG: GNAT family N-acetyltransferase [Chloroflexota bacterium]